MTRPFATLLLAIALSLQAQEPRQFETPRFSVWSSNGSVPDKDFEAMLESLYEAWKDKLGQAVEPRAKLKVSIYYDPPEFEKKVCAASLPHTRLSVMRIFVSRLTVA